MTIKTNVVCKNGGRVNLIPLPLNPFDKFMYKCGPQTSPYELCGPPVVCNLASPGLVLKLKRKIP